jgi:type I restriction enzyme S subunit
MRTENRCDEVIVFPPGWRIKKFGAILKSSQYGLSVSSDSSGSTAILRMGNIEEGVVNYKNLAYVNITDEEKQKYRIKENDLLFNRTNSLQHVGKLGIVQEERDMVFASYLVRFEVNPDIAFPQFVAYYFSLIGTRNKLKRIATPGVCQHNINQSDLQHQLKIPVPPLSEQIKIAKIIYDWDIAINQTRKLIVAKKNRKKALMQQLLDRNEHPKSFEKDKWGCLPLGSLITPVSRPVPKPNKPYTAIGLRSHGKGTFQRIVAEPEKVAMDTLFRIERDDIIVNITFAWEGAIAIAHSDDEGGLVSHRFPTYRVKKNATLSFLRQFILTKRFVWDLGLISPGGAGRNRVLSKNDFLKLKVHVPSKAVQQKIGKILSSADQEIKFLEDNLITLEKQKRGLMQKLLTGEVRVKT